MSDPFGMLGGMNEHTVSLTELKAKVGNAILLAATRNCRFVVSRYGTPMGAVVGFRDLERLRKLEDSEPASAAPSPQQSERERHERLVVSIVDKILLGEEVRPTTPEEWEIYFDASSDISRSRFTAEGRELLAEVKEAALQRRAERGKSAA